MNLREYADREMLAMDVANMLAGELKQTLRTNDTASIAVPGGTTPAPVFDMLSATALEWDRVTILPGDERWVPEDDTQSNARLIRQHLLTGQSAKAQFMSLYMPGTDVIQGAALAAQRIAPVLPLSIVLLGMGADMHTASIFPDAAGLQAALAPDAPAAVAITPPGQQMARVTLTASVLKDATSKHIVIFGDDKRQALERARHLPPEKAPVAAILHDSIIHWAA